MPSQNEATLLLKIQRLGEEALSKTADALKTIGAIGATVFASISGFVALATRAYRESEEATNALNQSLITQGIYTKELSGRYQEMAAELQKTTTFSDDAIVSAQALLQAYLGQKEISKELITATLDLATAKKMDLNSAAEIVGKTIGTNVNTLKRHGIEIDANASKSEKLRQVTAGLEERFGGQAKAAADGLGSLVVMKNAFSDLLEVAGEHFAPLVIFVAKKLTELANEFRNNEIIAKAFSQSLIFLIKTGTVLIEVVTAMGEVFSNIFMIKTKMVTDLMRGSFKGAFDDVKTGVTDTVSKIKDRYDSLNKNLKDIDDIYGRQEQRKKDEELRRQKENARQREQIARGSIMTEEELFRARDRNEILRELDKQKLKDNIQLQTLARRMENERGTTAGLNAELEKRDFLDSQFDHFGRMRLLDLSDFRNQMNSRAMNELQSVLTNMAGMQHSRLGVLVAIGKAAAMAQTAINTAKSAVEALAFGTAIGGPVLGWSLAAPIIAYGAEQQARIAGINLAHGGIIRSRPGGVIARIGEGGQDEAVIPLERGGTAISSNKINLTVHGGFLGNELQAKEFALALDRELLKLRRSKQSLAFDTGIT